ncbi:hypothetical protein_gp224 [Bacillus phage vB_BceM_WH1]|nr:hypothetical protein_gp224 [Bacillus phage vB_BceM_WH1]
MDSKLKELELLPIYYHGGTVYYVADIKLPHTVGVPPELAQFLEAADVPLVKHHIERSHAIGWRCTHYLITVHIGSLSVIETRRIFNQIAKVLGKDKHDYETPSPERERINSFIIETSKYISSNGYSLKEEVKYD